MKTSSEISIVADFLKGDSTTLHTLYKCIQSLEEYSISNREDEYDSAVETSYARTLNALQNENQMRKENLDVLFQKIKDRENRRLETLENTLVAVESALLDEQIHHMTATAREEAFISEAARKLNYRLFDPILIDDSGVKLRYSLIDPKMIVKDLTDSFNTKSATSQPMVLKESVMAPIAQILKHIFRSIAIYIPGPTHFLAMSFIILLGILVDKPIAYLVASITIGAHLYVLWSATKRTNVA